MTQITSKFDLMTLIIILNTEQSKGIKVLTKILSLDILFSVEIGFFDKNNKKFDQLWKKCRSCQF